MNTTLFEFVVIIDALCFTIKQPSGRALKAKDTKRISFNTNHTLMFLEVESINIQLVHNPDCIGKPV